MYAYTYVRVYIYIYIHIYIYIDRGGSRVPWPNSVTCIRRESTHNNAGSFLGA